MLTIMESSGQFYRLHKKYFKEFSECKSSGVKSIGYDKIGAVFILLAIAMSLSSIIMSVELLIKKVMNKGG